MFKPDYRLGRSAALAAVLVLLSAGVVHRLLAARIRTALDRMLELKQPLSSLPLQLGGWAGRDVPIDEETRRIAGDDDFINRVYVDGASDRSVAVYVGYIGKPRSTLAHRPDICYPAHGYKEVRRGEVTVRSAAGQEVPALLLEYASPQMAGQPQLVLVSYLINGRYSNSTAEATEYNARGPGLLSSQPLAYLARVQVSIRNSGDREADIAALSDFMAGFLEPIGGIMPEAGK